MHYKILLDGLEATEVNLSVCKSIIDFRIDANTYKKEYIKTNDILKKLDSKTINDKMVSIQNFGAYSLCNNIVFTDSGIPFLMTQNVRHNYIDWNNVRYVNEASHKMLYKSHCLKNQVLVTMAGEYLGRVAVYDKDFICSSNQAIAKITLQQDVSPYYVSTFLNTKYGQNQINRFKTITGQPNINMSLIQSLMIPEVSENFSGKIEELVEKANNMLTESKKVFEEALTALLTDISFDKGKVNQKPDTIKNLSESLSTSGRLDAEYYQNKYDSYMKLIISYSNSYMLLGDVCQIKDTNYVPNPNNKYSYIELSNVNSQGNITDCSEIYGIELPTRARRKVLENDVIISSVEGSLSSCALVTAQYNECICTNGFFVINSKLLNAETLLALFKTEPIQALMRKGCSGTILSAIGKDEFMKIPLPLIKADVQKQVKLLVNESAALRTGAISLLQNVKKLVEIAVEQGEEKALEFLAG